MGNPASPWTFHGPMDFPFPCCYAEGLMIEDLKDAPVEAADHREPLSPAEPVDPPSSRFLYVDIAAMRAKQLRKGALPRLGAEGHHPLKAERVAMEEVRKGLVTYDLPEFKPKKF
jgi:DNA-directed RNA polymerase subunit K/omega